MTDDGSHRRDDGIRRAHTCIYVKQYDVRESCVVMEMRYIAADGREKVVGINAADAKRIGALLGVAKVNGQTMIVGSDGYRRIRVEIA